MDLLCLLNNFTHTIWPPLFFYLFMKHTIIVCKLKKCRIKKIYIYFSKLNIMFITIYYSDLPDTSEQQTYSVCHFHRPDMTWGKVSPGRGI